MKYLLLALLCGCAVPYRAARTVVIDRTFVGRPDGLVREIEFKDTERGGGLFVLTDPKAQAIGAVSTNAFSAHTFSLGEGSIVLDPNAPALLRAAGEAVGAGLGKTLKTSVVP